MATQYGFYVDVSKCIDCYSCEVACKQWNGIKAGSVKWRRVNELTTGTFPDVKRTFVSLSCMHCGDPPCEAICPVGAISKQFEGGAVLVDQDECIGCHACFLACPFGVPQYGDDGTMQNCNMCLDRLKEGKKPACATTCPVGALQFGTLEELSALASAKAARKLVGDSQPSVFLSETS